MSRQKRGHHARNEAQKEKELYRLTYSRLVFCYLLAGLLGTVWETAFVWFVTGKFEPRNASFISPFNFVYGSGFVLMIVCLHRVKNPFALFFFGALLGGVAEYALSWAEELIFHTRSWDYRGMFLNIDGRTTVPYMIFWGIGGLLIIRYLYPFIMRLLNKIPQKLLTLVAVFAGVYIALDLALTAAVIIRYAMRRSGQSALTFVGVQIDRFFKKDVIRRSFPNMYFLS
ncbi:MAG: putative ABC transporter permease [Clostridia bacterium]|nr:putative ABC transporter permease [Clostridia bacterium]